MWSPHRPRRLLPSPAYFWPEFPGEPARAHRSIPPPSTRESFPSRPRTYIRPYDIPRRCIWKIRSDGRKREKRVAAVRMRDAMSREMRRAKCTLARENIPLGVNRMHGERAAALCALRRTCGRMHASKNDMRLARRCGGQLHAACPFIKTRAPNALNSITYGVNSKRLYIVEMCSARNFLFCTCRGI